jgi:hypothetical protein
MVHSDKGVMVYSDTHTGSRAMASHAERHREYYMGEGGGFPRVRVVVSQMSPRLLVACLITKSVQNEF